MAQPDSEGWIEWAGGESPVHGRCVVEVRTNTGAQCVIAADAINWQSRGLAAYRVVPA